MKGTKSPRCGGYTEPRLSLTSPDSTARRSVDPNLRAAFHPRACVVVFLELLGRNLLHEERFLLLLTAPTEANGAADAPDGSDAKSNERLFPAHSRHREGTNEIEQHAQQIRQQAKHRDNH